MTDTDLVFPTDDKSTNYNPAIDNHQASKFHHLQRPKKRKQNKRVENLMKLTPAE